VGWEKALQPLGGRTSQFTPHGPKLIKKTPVSLARLL
jgi:hypothetical protein